MERFKQEDYVSGYDLVTEALWPLILNTFDTSLSFVTSSGNLKLFHNNYQTAVSFTE